MSQLQKVSPALVLGIFLMAGVPAEAAKNKWSSQGPFGGTVTAIAVDPNDAQTVYVGVEADPNAPQTGGVFRTDDGGLSWAKVSDTEPALERVQALAFDNDVPPNLYAGTNGDGIFRTDDGGISWLEVNGTSNGDPSDDLDNLAVVSLAIHPDIVDLDATGVMGEAIIFAGTNGGGVFRGEFVGALSDVVWSEQNLGLGNRVVFDLEIPKPQQPVVIINEVDANNSGTDTMEFIELFGPENLPLDGLVLVLYDANEDQDFDPNIDCITEALPLGNLSYNAIDLDGFTLDNNGFFVVGDAGVPGVDLVGDFADPIGDDDLLNTSGSGSVSAAVALYFGDADDFPDGTPATDDSLLDVVAYQTGGGTNDQCFMLQLGLGLFVEHVNEGNAVGGSNANSNSRLPDGGQPGDQLRWASQPPSPDLRNVPLTLLFAATDLEGIFRTTDLREAPMFWAPFNNGLASDVVFSLGVDPVDPDVTCPLSSFTLYAGTSGEGVFRTTDPCILDIKEDWEAAASGLPGGTTVTAMAIAPTIAPTSEFKSVIYAGTEFGEIFKSFDNGEEWAEHSSGLGGLGVDSLAVEPTIYGFEDPLRPSRVYSGTRGGGVYKTIDSASNWFLTTPDVDDLTVGVFTQDVEIDPAAPDTLWVGTFGGGIFRSVDDGLNWTKDLGGGMSIDDVRGSPIVNTLVIDPTDSLTIYAGTDLEGAGKSTDGGDTWAPMEIPDAISEEKTVLELVLDPNDGSAMTLLAVTGGLFRSADGGATWSDLAGSNADLADSSILTVAVDPTDSAHLYAGTQERGIFETVSGGASWTRVGLPSLTESFIRSLAIDPADPLVIYAGTDGGGVFKSVDGGSVWIERNNGLPTNSIILSLRIDLEDSSIIYAGTDGDGVFKTLDGGANWAEFNVGLTNFVVRDIEIAPRDNPELDSQFLHAATFGGGVFDFEKEELFNIFPQVGLVTTEAGGIDTFTISLTRIPSANVILEIESSDSTEGSVEPTVLLFPPDEGALIDQFVTVTGLADGVIDGDQDYSIILKPALSQDTDFDGVDPDDVSAINEDFIPQIPGVTVEPSSLTTTEDGATDTFEVSLRSTPTANVTISLTSLDPGEVTVSPGALLFTPANATTPQTVTVTGVQDGEVDGDQTVLIETASTSPDANYEGITVPDVTVTNVDNGLTVLFETADLGPTGLDPSGPVIGSNTFLGAKFTITETVTVVNLGGHVVAHVTDPDTTIFVAVVPLAPNDFPPDTTLEDDAVFGTTFNAPLPSNEVSVPADFVLEPGRYAMIFGSGQFGATGRAQMPQADFDIGTPEYFFIDVANGVFVNGGLGNARFFINGFFGVSEDIFSDGFESGDTTAWSLTSP